MNLIFINFLKSGGGGYLERGVCYLEEIRYVIFMI